MLFAEQSGLGASEQFQMEKDFSQPLFWGYKQFQPLTWLAKRPGINNMTG